MYQEEYACDISDDRSPVRIFVREILDHNTPLAMDLETGQHLTCKVRKQYLPFFCSKEQIRLTSTIYLAHSLGSPLYFFTVPVFFFFTKRMKQYRGWTLHMKLRNYTELLSAYFFLFSVRKSETLIYTAGAVEAPQI